MDLSCNVGHIEALRNIGTSRLWAKENLTTIFSRELALGKLKESRLLSQAVGKSQRTFLSLSF